MQISRVLVVLLALAGVLSSGCAARVYSRSRVQYAAPVVFVDAPELVYVGPGVYVVRDYNDAVYYADGYYWSNRGGVWYHTSHWSSPWSRVHVGVVPGTIAYRDHRVYAHYHGDVHAHTYRPAARPAGYAQHQKVAVVHHAPPPAPQRVSAGATVHVDADVGGRASASAGASTKSHHNDDHADRRPARVDRPDRDDRPARVEQRPDRDDRAQPQPQKVKIDRADAPQQARSDGPKKKAAASTSNSKRSKKKSK